MTHVCWTPVHVDLPNSTYYKLFQSTPKNNYIGHIHHLECMLRVCMGSDHMGHSLKYTRQWYHLVLTLQLTQSMVCIKSDKFVEFLISWFANIFTESTESTESTNTDELKDLPYYIEFAIMTLFTRFYARVYILRWHEFLENPNVKPSSFCRNVIN
jgi:hypothetical protein